MPSLCSVSRVVTPGQSRSTMNAEMPLCFAAGSVFAKTSAWSATHAYEIQFFCAVEDVGVALTPRGRPHRGHVGAGGGLGQPEAGELLAARLRHQVALLLLLGPVAQQRERVQPDVDGDQRPERGFAALDLLARERLGDEVEPGAAVLLRDDDSEHPELGHALDRPHVELVVDVVLDRVREDALVDELANGLLDSSLLDR